MMGNDFAALDRLLKQEDEEPVPSTNPGLGPGSFGSSAPIDDAVIPKPKKVGAKDIWEEDDLEEDDGFVVDPSDTRLRPEYDILYKQDVSANDCFLGMDQDKDPGTHCCNEIIVKIELPGESMKTLDLDVQRVKLVVQSKKHMLALPLPYPCDPKNGNAKWDPTKEILSVTVPIIREGLLD